ncbi:MAG: TetR/AcrR family transcriptional regulator [Gemmatimonadetes bacterium]|nr:TetR/AcrR family transcriptional regulator [Gemmatimonadota bacterium]
MPRRSEDWLAETRERISSAAAELVVRRGFHGFTLRDLLFEAWVSTGCFYAHFADKEAVLRDVADWHCATHVRRLDFATIGDPAGSRLRSAARLAVAEYAHPRATANARLEVLMLAELITPGGVAGAYGREIERLVVANHRILREGQRDGQIDRRLFAPSAAMAVTGLMLTLPLMRALGFRYTPARMGAVLDRMIHSLEADSKKPRPRNRSGRR